MSQTQVAVIGLGIIGSRCAENLAKSVRVKSWNRTPKGLPHEAADLPDAIQGSSWISLYVKDAAAVRELLPVILEHAEKDAVVMNHATIDLATTRWAAEQCAAAGLGFLDCPFTGSRDAAQGAGLVYYLGGDPELTLRATPVLQKTSKQIILSGMIGTATILKLITNLISACTVQALAEALGTATSHGITAESVLEAVGVNAHNSVLAQMKLPKMAVGDFETHFSLENMLKDSRYVLDLAREAGVETPSIAAVSARMAEVCAQGHAQDDFSALAAPYLKK